MVQCAVPGCQNYALARSIGIPFHRFPIDAKLRRNWLVKIRNDAFQVNASTESLKTRRVCGKHFVPSDYERDLAHELTGSKRRYILKKGAIPSLFPFAPEPALFEPHRPAFKKREKMPLQQQHAAECESVGLPSSSSGRGESQLISLGESQFISLGESEITDTEIYSSPFKTDTPSKLSLFKPGSSEEATTTETEELSEISDSEMFTDCHSSKVIVKTNKLFELFKRCQHCGEGIISKSVHNNGAKCTIYWECVSGHRGAWQSCEDIRGMPAVHLELASSIVFTGNTYQSVQNFANLMGLTFLSKSTFNSIQNTYVLPVIDNTYKSQYFENMAMLIGKSMDGEGISLLGDGRSDSTGFSAKYTTYSMMEESTQKIVDMQLVQVTETSSSVAMEKEGFVRSLGSILEHGINVETVTTDRAPSIRKLMRTDYEQIGHQFDCWHICKGVKKKCLAIGRKKSSSILLKWTKSITNHLWYSCSACGGEAEELKRVWQSILYHVTGVHQWEEKDGSISTCKPPPLSEDDQELRMWIDPKSTAYRDLTSIVMDNRLNKDLEQLTLFKHTGGLESYHSTMLKFAPKRLHFHYPAMKGRMQLAVIDHNSNTGRGTATTETGKPVYRFVSSKMQGGEWTAKIVPKAKSYQYAYDMVESVLERRKEKSVLFKDKHFFVDLPKLPPNIAKERRPPVEELLAKKNKHK